MIQTLIILIFFMSIIYLCGVCYKIIENYTEHVIKKDIKQISDKVNNPCIHCWIMLNETYCEPLLNPSDAVWVDDDIKRTYMIMGCTETLLTCDKCGSTKIETLLGNTDNNEEVEEDE